jgi:hypothetical protein
MREDSLATPFSKTYVGGIRVVGRGQRQEMEVSMEQQHPPSPMRLLEILKDRFGALEAVANSSIMLARYAPKTSWRWICSSRNRCWNSAARGGSADGVAT